MIQSKEKVVPLDLDFSEKSKIQDKPGDLIVSKVWESFSQPFLQLVNRFFERIDDELFNLSDKAENSTLQTVYFDAMRYLRKERESMQSNYAQGLDRRYSDFWAGKLEKRDDLATASKPESEDLSLIDNDVLEEALAITTMVSKGNNLFHYELLGLEKRFAVLAGKKELESQENPIGPTQVCYTLDDVLKPLDLDLNIKLLVYKLYDQTVMQGAGGIYRNVNELLINQNVLPDFAVPIRKGSVKFRAKPRSGAKPGQRNSTDIYDEHGRVIGDTGDEAAYVETFYALQNLMGGWRSARGGVSLGHDADAGPAYQTEDLLNAISKLQFAEDGAPSVQEQDSSGQVNVKAFIASELNKGQPDDGKKRPLGRVDEDVIDMVGIIFDYILEDENLPNAVKAPIGRLQIPIVKIAILDKTFFAKKTHPARQLLNSLAKAGVSLGKGNECTETPLYAKIQSVVMRVLEEFDQDIALFSKLLAELNSFLDREEQRSLVVEQRTRQTTHSKEQLTLAKKTANYEVIKALQGKEVAGVIRSFLEGSWKDVLVLAFLRRQKEPDGWHSMVDVIGRLINSITPQQDPVEQKRILQTIPCLIKDIQVGLEKISCHPVKVSSFLEDIKLCHIAVFGDALAVMDIETHHQQDNESLDRPDSKIRETMHDPLSGIGEVAISEILSEMEAADVVKDDFYVTAESMEIGQWVDFSETEISSIRGKLSWKSPVTANCVFVNNKGVKVVEKSMRQLATALRDGKATIVKEVKVPLMDRALAAMMQTLNKPAQEGEPVLA